MQCIRLGTLLLMFTFVVDHGDFFSFSAGFPPFNTLPKVPTSTLAVLGLDGHILDGMSSATVSIRTDPTCGILSGSGVRCADFHPGQDTLVLPTDLCDPD